MGVWLDDEFPEHPKVEALDDDLARWLYVAGLCYANRNLTGGRIPKGAALRLTDKANPKLIKRLLLVLVPGKGPLWEDHGDHYRIHDYDQHQQSAEKRRAEIEDAKKKRSEHAKRAADARWAAEQEQALSMNRASPEHPPGIAGAPPNADPEQGFALARASAAGRATPGRPNALVPTGGSSSNHDVGPAAGSEEEDLREKISTAARLVAERRLTVRTGPALTNATEWLRSVRGQVLTDHGDELHRLAEQGLHPKAMADRIQPPVTSPYPEAGTCPASVHADVEFDDEGHAYAVPRRAG